MVITALSSIVSCAITILTSIEVLGVSILVWEAIILLLGIVVRLLFGVRGASKAGTNSSTSQEDQK